MRTQDYIAVSLQLDRVGLIWNPEIGDEIALRGNENHVSILVDPQGLKPTELRQSFVWLPTVEQLVAQIEARQGLIYHAGVTPALEYEAVIRTSLGIIETTANSLRVVFGKALNNLIASVGALPLH